MSQIRKTTETDSVFVVVKEEGLLMGGMLSFETMEGFYK